MAKVDSARILLVDNTLQNIQTLGAILRQEGYQINVAQNGLQALKLLEKIQPDLILLDVMMPEMDGFATCKRLKESTETKDIPVIFLAAKVEPEDIVRGFELGAVDYISKPFNPKELLVRVKTHVAIRTLQKELEQQNAALVHELRVTQELFKEASYRLDGALLGESETIRKVRDLVFRYAKSDDNTLLEGPPGSGDEAIARAIHRVSNRSKQAFIYVNCLQVQAEELTNVFSLRDVEEDFGKFELAHKGTIYLDGVHELSIHLQKQLAETLHEFALHRAANQAPNPDVRVIAYSWRNLREEVQQLQFDPELYKLLAQNLLTVPSLAERCHDIPVLVNYFVQQYARRVGKNIEKISHTTLERLCHYSWPGSIRELQNIVERSIIISDDGVLEIGDEFLHGGLRVDRYCLVEKLGVGGMGEVWRATHQLLARPAAIKLIRTEFIDDANKKHLALKRFRREAQATANLLSPNTVKLYDYGITETGSLYYVMELLNGLDLSSMVSRFGPLLAERVVMLIQQACRSLMEAHNAGLIHRDIKPQNLFVCKLGAEYDFLKILDFGIVKYRDEKSDKRITQATEFIGSPMYTAPEIILEDDNDGDERVDIYSLGCVAYWILTGKLVCRAKKVSQMIKYHLTTAPEPPSRVCDASIPHELDDIIMSCLEKKPENRPQSAHELWAALDGVKFPRPWTQERAENWWRKNAIELVIAEDQVDPDELSTLIMRRPPKEK